MSQTISESTTCVMHNVDYTTGPECGAECRRMTREYHHPDRDFDSSGVETSPSILRRIGYQCIGYADCGSVVDGEVVHAERCQSYNAERSAYARGGERYRDAANGVDVHDTTSARFVDVVGGQMTTYSIDQLRRHFEYPDQDGGPFNLHAAHGGRMVVVRVVATSPVHPEGDDYYSAAYAIVSDNDVVYGRFTARIDGRA